MLIQTILKLTAKQIFDSPEALKIFNKIPYITIQKQGSKKYDYRVFQIGGTSFNGNKIKQNTGTNLTLEDALKDREKIFTDKVKGGFTKDETKILFNPKVPRERRAFNRNTITKQRAVDDAAETFDINKPETWQGLVDLQTWRPVTGKPPTEAFFVLPKDKKIRKFVEDKLIEARKATDRPMAEGFDETKTVAGMMKIFGNPEVKTLHSPGPIPGIKIAYENLGVVKSPAKGSTEKIGRKIRRLLEQHYYTTGQKRELKKVKKLRSLINERSGLTKGSSDPASLELEHTQSFINVLRGLGIKDSHKFLKDIEKQPDQFQRMVIRRIGDKALKDSNMRFVKRVANQEKAILFENVHGLGNKYDHKRSIVAIMNKVDKLEKQGMSDQANALRKKLEETVKQFQINRAAEAKANPLLAMKYDFTGTEFSRFPEFARISNDTSIYGKYTVEEMGLGEQLMKIRKQMDVTLPNEDIYTQGTKLNPYTYEPPKDFDILNQGGRVSGKEGGRVYKAPGGMIGEKPKSVGPIGGDRGSVTIGGGPNNKVGTIESMLAGIGAGIIDIPRGAFTLGAALMDLGLGTNKAAKVEQWFDDLTNLDEMSEETTMGSLVRTLVNLGVPGAAAWRMGEKVTRKALLHKRNGNYFRITDPKLEERMKTALNAKGRMAATLGAAGAAGVSDAIFIGDPETVGTMGDLFGGGPTQLTPNDSTEASREVINRLKFGVDGALFLGLIGGTGSSIKSVWKRRNDLESNNDALDKFLSKLRPRGAKPQEFFELERKSIGVRAGDINYAGQVARKLDKHIDAIFPFVKNPFNKMGNKGRAEFMEDLNETLLSGKIEMDVTGKSAFGVMDPDRITKITKLMKDRGAKQSDIDGVLDSFEQMRSGWSHMFSRLGYSMKDADPKVLEEFRGIIGDKFKGYLGSTYEIFQNKSLIPLLNYAPTEEAVTKAVKMVQDSARTAGKKLTDEEARHFVDKMVESARLPRGMATSKEKASGIFLEVPDFFANKTVLSDLEFNPKIALDSLTPDARKVIDEVLGKVSDPMQTMLAGSGRLSLITRRNQFYEELMKKSADDIAAGKKGFFHESELDAFKSLGGNIKQIEIDPSRTIEAGITNPLNGKWAEKGVAEAIEESAMLARDKGTIRQMYDSLVLYPKATSQIAKTILSPITHVRNFVSAGAFAGANGLIPGLVSPTDMAAAMKDAYKALQIPGARMANDAYRDLLRLGVVNSNVRLGDLQRLLKDVSFGETLTAQKGLRGLMRPLSKAKKWTEEMYTAEDDFWKITSYALERQRLNKAYSKYGIKVTDDALNEEAASIVRNNIPNYDMVNDFIKGLRQLPFGNFVSFPAEIMRTSTNILGRALKEINYAHTLDDGRVVNPLRGIGYKRLFGFGTTVVGVPYGTVEAAKAIYDVSEDEMEAMRRFVPDWSKNSTLVPIRDDETGELKYVDFSHANAYDTMIRPINTMINSINEGIDEGEIMKSVATGMFEATAETLSPFVSESIWTEAASDIILRNGRTREGRRLWTEATPWGERMSITAGHLVKTQMPGSVAAFDRMGLSIREEVDEYGRSYELGDELAGIAGFRAIKLDPIRSMKFKIADFRTGINAARREFTSPLLKGGPVDPLDVVNRFEVANQAAYAAQQKMFKDYYAARTLGAGQGKLDLQFADRVSNVQLNAIKSGRFKPFIPSENIQKAFADNARAIGEPNAYLIAERQIRNMINKYNNLPLWGGFAFPRFENPFIGRTQLSPQAGISPTTERVLNTQNINPAGIVGNQAATLNRGQQVFGATDPIFGVG